MATKVFFYTLRPYDELSIAQRLAPQLDIEFGYTQEYPTLENADMIASSFFRNIIQRYIVNICGCRILCTLFNVVFVSKL